MRKQITRVSIMQTAKVSAVLYFIMSLPIVLLMAVPAMLFSRAGAGPSLSVGMLVAMPILYLIFGFIFTMIFAWVYNFVAGMVGGIEFTTTEVGPA